jgi:hypothetical protein
MKAMMKARAKAAAKARALMPAAEREAIEARMREAAISQMWRDAERAAAPKTVDREPYDAQLANEDCGHYE